MADPAPMFLRLTSPAARDLPVRPPLLCVVCGATVPDLPRLTRLDGRSPAEIHEDRHRQEETDHA